MTDEQSLRAELAEITAQREVLRARASRIRSMLDGPRVEPLLCYWQHFSYCEDPALDDTVDEAFAELKGGEEHGLYAGVGVRVNGLLITKADRGIPTFRRDSEAVRAEADAEHRKLLAEGMT